MEDNQGLYVDGKQFHWDIEELREENKHMDLGDFLSKDLAERVAKAYIHALNRLSDQADTAPRVTPERMGAGTSGSAAGR